jgi:hypothetical protein
VDGNILGQLASGQRVVDRYNTHIHPVVIPLLAEVLSKINLNGEQFMVVQVNFDHVVGETTCIVTNPGDRIIYAKRPKRLGYTRFVKNRAPEFSNSVVCILMKAQDQANAYVLITAFIGERPEPEPWDRNKSENSVKFWSNHALVWGSEPIIPGTETETYP